MRTEKKTRNTFCRTRSLSNATFSFLITWRSSSSKSAAVYKISSKSNDFYRASVYWRATDARYWYSKSVCLSVCPSVRYVPVPYENGLTYRHSFSPYGSPIILVLPASNISTKFRQDHPLRGAKYRWGRKKSRCSNNKSLYLANDTYRHSYYGRRIGTRMRSIKWCHFQWPWTNLSPVFKVTPLFDAKYFTNGYRYGHS